MTLVEGNSLIEREGHEERRDEPGGNREHPGSETGTEAGGSLECRSGRCGYRNLGGAKAACPPGPVCRFHLKKVAHRKDAIERECLQGLAAPAFESASEVRERHPGHQADIDTGELAEQQPFEIPVDHVDPGHIPGADHQVGILRGLQKLRNVHRVVRKIAIHLENKIMREVLQYVLERRDVSSAQTFFACSMQYKNPFGMLPAQLVGDLACAVGGVVVNDQDVGTFGQFAYGLDDLADVFPFIVCRYDNDGTHQARKDLR